jgi:hypothetical protein
MNSNGIANATGKQLLQIIPINIVVVLAIIGSAVGLYYKFDARIASLEKSIDAPDGITNRVDSMQKRLDELAPTIYRTDTNVLWLMDKQKGAHPQP